MSKPQQAAAASVPIVDIHVEDHSGAPRRSWPITGGVPLPKGTVSDPAQIGIDGADCQARVLSRWSDGSIRWVLLDYQADVAGGGKATNSVVLSPKPLVAPQGNTVTETADEIVVDTGALKFAVSK
ncbi:MAG: hypothetical protein J7M19_08860, partial [Planctomycetes bacterium]|nr:hypothetical protein [Planctomycetota bacterium]